MNNSDKYVEPLLNVNLDDNKARNSLREYILRDSNSLTNREFHFLMEEIVAKFNDMKYLKFFLSFNFLLRGANKTFNVVFRHIFEGACSLEEYVFLQKEACGQIYQQLSFYRKKAQKYNSNDLLDEINNLVELSQKLYEGDALYECYTLLEIVADLIAIVNKFPFKRNTILYFTMLFNIFIHRGCLFSAANALYRLIRVEKKVNLKAEYVQTLVGLMHLKDNEEEHGRMFCGLPCIDARTFLQETKGVEYEQDMPFVLNEESLCNFIFYKQNIKKTFECDDKMLRFVSFLRLNNFNFSLDDGILIFDGTYCKKSNSAKVFEIVKGMKERRENVVVRNVEAIRIRENLKREKMIKETLIKEEKEDNQIKVEKKEKKARKDLFTKNFNLFRVYLMKSRQTDDPNDLKMRQYQLDMEYQRDYERKERLRQLYEQRKDSIAELLKNYEERKKKSIQPIAVTQEDVKVAKTSWRTAEPESFKTENIYKPKVESGKADSNIYQPPKITMRSSSFDPKEMSKPGVYDPSGAKRSFDSKEMSKPGVYDPSGAKRSFDPKEMSKPGVYDPSGAKRTFDPKEMSKPGVYDPSGAKKTTSKSVENVDNSKVYKFVRKNFMDTSTTDRPSHSKHADPHSTSNLGSSSEKPEKEIKKGESWRTAKK
ncbi:hypothetical protein THOM_0501 [Trachipleistophora hominis]|uniref:Uncharacterized protein n=1 Tax=Trachipleistophora hominis TaxID=72359 RepID=L7JYG4_TRAHO|nr:hypothetical protein THOM_0501 [Trachipleistophora hominis]